MIVGFCSSWKIQSKPLTAWHPLTESLMLEISGKILFQGVVEGCKCEGGCWLVFKSWLIPSQTPSVSRLKALQDRLCFTLKVRVAFWVLHEEKVMSNFSVLISRTSQVTYGCYSLNLSVLKSQMYSSTKWSGCATAEYEASLNICVCMHPV